MPRGVQNMITWLKILKSAKNYPKNPPPPKKNKKNRHFKKVPKADYPYLYCMLVSYWTPFSKLTVSVQRVPEPDLLPGISFDTRPDSVLEISG